jgi:hypothetical protein
MATALLLLNNRYFFAGYDLIFLNTGSRLSLIAPTAVIATTYRTGTYPVDTAKNLGPKSPPSDAPIGHPPALPFQDMCTTHKNIIGQQLKEILVFFKQQL